ncbi:tRNA (adenosine(37)-N6)-threonylcarbamoyltransferase complex ATPase subunit type 1 TsaE [Clostridium estertheticum]|uniref:tRNA (Adenosine(37)-N6)-threonylcarbamoyltransferase complex ATPase subunit type 1 TsaE n=1 Tax=Clostridium estertheticum TaxID=238834 RepID=A0AA47EHH7_9CLOT|nr:tRNA (adenosine(37)-N6)-threonylcarbamoyltransferase complex ATPase subunit type 1 TsaE [Clostridium estertheticum]MBU3156816.1 tRNA (adenosine(37)-N6)-threonylcarbamoyltransferase complex ATPase subunit type 1 TsaE [Clostridium estertheticum]MBU3200031.1 tRNA (adenosine(37)-N6)-threonylcarbamoyltransferase complex ATPase subunit type 1 TsaE [Clostridium estertheticum]WAG59494.1 tRNA (adenosine(37)-N6)-threonylcarbamoyltransferase complex ATPase subunit type 1 TsaE [Clostridium estertheticum]
MEYIVTTVDETYKIGELIGSLVNSGDIICLIGDLGTGKTHLTKGIAKGLDIKDNITSPTFTIVNEYTGRLKLYHFDVYRVNDPDEIEAIGFDEYIFSDGVSVIEWANYIEEIIPPNKLTITIEKLPELGDNYRKINMEYSDKRYNYVKEIIL